ncbi:FxsA family protein [Amphibacillus jilinensis]|uniref:FxsA family protein n=1 Tax=Amphibacillus jilinensis TaxID=1216008 RepID=UPI0002FD48A1|nr:FxsA family protein [Amphibacillus jilinensis]
MFKWLFLLLLIMPALEIGVFIWAGAQVGIWSVIGLIVFTGLVGATLARQQGMDALRRAQESMQAGQVPADAIFDGICILIGGVVLLTPGFITDFFGFILLMPLTRSPLKGWLKAVVQKMMNNGNVIIHKRF